jgi:hypothetical protein
MDEFTIFVYFLLDTETNEIKIGQTNNPRERIEHLCHNTGRQLIVLAIVEDRLPLEQIMHMKFENLHMHGDWFRSDPSLISFINNIHISNTETESDDILDLESTTCPGCGKHIKANTPRGLQNAMNAHSRWCNGKPVDGGNNHREIEKERSL